MTQQKAARSRRRADTTPPQADAGRGGRSRVPRVRCRPPFGPTRPLRTPSGHPDSRKAPLAAEAVPRPVQRPPLVYVPQTPDDDVTPMGGPSGGRRPSGAGPSLPPPRPLC